MINVKCQKKECLRTGSRLNGGLCDECWGLLTDEIKTRIVSAQKNSLSEELSAVRVALKWLEGK